MEIITSYDVPLVCGAAPAIGCGSRVKPLLMDLEEQSAIKEAWVNRAGTIVAIVWSGQAHTEEVVKPVFSQVEYCDNLIFYRRAALDQLGERLLDANRTIGQPNKITVIFGRKITKQYKGKLQTVIEDIDLPNPVIRSHYGHGFIKQYVRDHLMLRTEAATNNVNDYGVKKAVENLPKLRERLQSINDNYLNIQQDILETFVDRGQLRRLAAPTILPNAKRVPGLKLDHPRQLALMHALVRFTNLAAANTFSTCELHAPTAEALGCTLSQYRLSSLRYDLSKAPGQRIGRKHPSLPSLSAASPRLLHLPSLP